MRLIVVLMLLVHVNSHAEIYKCTNSDGASYNQTEPCPVLPIVYQPTDEEYVLLAKLTEFIKFNKYEDARSLAKTHPGLINFPNPAGYTLLEQAIDSNLIDVGEFLIATDVDLNQPTRKGVTPLHRAAFYDKVDFVKLLISHGANVEARDEHMRTPLFFAADAEKINSVRTLIEGGANVDSLAGINPDLLMHDGRYQTPLYTAIANNKQKEVSKYLIDKGANIKVLDYWSNTALTLATHRSGWGDIVEELLNRGADCTAVHNGQNELNNIVDPQSLALMKGCAAGVERKIAVFRTTNMFSFPEGSSQMQKLLILIFLASPFLLVFILAAWRFNAAIAVLFGLLSAITLFLTFMVCVNKDVQFIANLDNLGSLNHFILTIIALALLAFSVLIGNRAAGTDKSASVESI